MQKVLQIFALNRNYMVEEIFKYYTMNKNKIIAFGFKKKGTNFYYEEKFSYCNFLLKFYVNLQNTIKTELIDLDSNEEYVLHLSNTATGSFVGNVREEFEQKLTKIRNSCFDKEIFKGTQTKQLIEYIKEKYNCPMEYLWAKFPTNAISRRQDNKKWFALLMAVSLNKIDGINDNSNKVVEVLNIRINPDKKNEIVDFKNIFPAYHMNKKSWASIILNESAPLILIKNLIDNSFELAKK